MKTSNAIIFSIALVWCVYVARGCCVDTAKIRASAVVAASKR